LKEILPWHPLYFLARHFSLDFSSFVDDISNGKENGFDCLKLDWDSLFFLKDIYKIRFWEGETAPNPNFPPLENGQIFAEVPSEATQLFPLLAKHGFGLVETRLTYFHLLQNLPHAEKSARFASENDIPYLRKVASGAVNTFDRYHADPFFSPSETDHYLETYIENCVKGFAEKVFVPDFPSHPASFVALSRLREPVFQNQEPLFRIPLTACLPENKGWHFHLCLEALKYARAHKSPCLVMTTQSTNGAVIHNCEKLGFKLGSVFHIFSKSFA
jgi:dTDP-4-amino-4,6-dideoxy-D-galactose acyltransferase